MRIALFIFVAISGCFAIVPCAKAEEPKKAVAEPTPVGQLIDDLDHDQFKRRKAAQAELLKRGKDAVPALLQAIDQSKNRNIREEAEKLVDKMLWPKDEATAKEQLAKLPEYVKNRQVDKFIATILLFREYSEEKERNLVWDFAKKLAQEGSEVGKRKIEFPKDVATGGMYLRDERVKGPIEAGPGHTYFVPFLEESQGGGFFSKTVVCSHLKIQNPSIHRSLVFCCGDLDATDVNNSIVIVLGKFRMSWDDNQPHGRYITKSLILCSGDVETRNLVNDSGSVIISGGELRTDTKYPKCYFGTKSKSIADLSSDCKYLNGLRFRSEPTKQLRCRTRSAA
jgi:hypothetical protein